MNCFLCSNTKSLFWRKIKNYGLICNSCYLLKFVATNVCQRVDSFQDTKDVISIRKSERVNKLHKIENKVQYQRNRLKNSQPIKSHKLSADFKISNQIYHKGIFYQIGDVVALYGFNSKIYYAQIKYFKTDTFLNSQAIINWLIPLTKKSGYNPDNYKIAYEDSSSRNLNCLEFVCRLPYNYYEKLHDYTQGHSYHELLVLNKRFENMENIFFSNINKNNNNFN